MADDEQSDVHTNVELRPSDDLVPVADIDDKMGPAESNKPFITVREIESGSYGKVYLVQRRSDLTLFVAKIMELSGVQERQRQYALNELRCHAQLNHFAIARQVDTCVSPSGDRTLSIVELGDAGDLNRILKARAQTGQLFAEHEVAFLFLQLVLGLDAMHKLRIMHRDIKAANVFVKSNGLLKLGDFGFSQQYEGTVSEDVAQSFCGTPSYVAPELWRRERYSKKADIWSLGVLGYELVSLHRPFGGETMAHLADNVCRCAYAPLPAQYSKGLHDVIYKMLSPVPQHRPATLQILAHPYMIFALNAFYDAILKLTSLPPDVQTAMLESVTSAKRDAEIIGNQVPAPSIASSGSTPSQNNSPTNGSIAPPSGGRQVASASPAAAEDQAIVLSSLMMKFTSDGWQMRVVILTPRALAVETPPRVHGGPCTDRKELPLRHIHDVRPFNVAPYINYVNPTSASRGITPEMLAANVQRMAQIAHLGIEIEIHGSGKRVLCAAGSVEEQTHWIQALLTQMKSAH